MRTRVGEFEVKCHYFTPRCKSYDSFITKSKVNGKDYLLTKYNLSMINAPKQILSDRILFLIDNYKMFRCEGVFFHTSIPSSSIIVPENIGTKLQYFFVVEPLPIVSLSDYVLENGVDQKFLQNYFPNVLNTLSSLHSIRFPYLALSPFTIVLDEKLWLRPPPLNPYTSPKSLMPPPPHKKDANYMDIDYQRLYRAPEWKSVPPFWQTDCWAIGAILCEYLIYGHPIFMSSSDTDQMLITQTILGPAPSKLNWPITKEANIADLPPILMRLLDYEPRVRPPMCLHIAIQIMMLINGEEEKSDEYDEHSIQTYSYTYSYSETPEKEKQPVRIIKQFNNSPQIFKEEKVSLSDKGIGSSTIKQNKVDLNESSNWELDIPAISPAKLQFEKAPFFEIPPINSKSDESPTFSTKSSKLSQKQKQKPLPSQSKPSSAQEKGKPKTPQEKPPKVEEKPQKVVEKLPKVEEKPQKIVEKPPKIEEKPQKVVEKPKTPEVKPVNDILLPQPLSSIKDVEEYSHEEDKESEEEEKPLNITKTTNISTMKLPYESPISSGIPYSYVYDSSYTPPVKAKSSGYDSPAQKVEENSYVYSTPKMSEEKISSNEKKYSSSYYSKNEEEKPKTTSSYYSKNDEQPPKSSSSYPSRYDEEKPKISSSYSYNNDDQKQKSSPQDDEQNIKPKQIHYTTSSQYYDYTSYKYNSDKKSDEDNKEIKVPQIQKIKIENNEPKTFSSYTYTPSYMSEKDLIEPIVGSYSSYYTDNAKVQKKNQKIERKSDNYSYSVNYDNNKKSYSYSNYDDQKVNMNRNSSYYDEKKYSSEENQKYSYDEKKYSSEENQKYSYDEKRYYSDKSYSDEMLDLERRVREIENSFNRSQKEIRKLQKTVSESQYSDDSFLDVQQQIRKLQGQLKQIDDDIIGGCVGCETGNAVRRGMSKLEADLMDIRSTLSSSQY